MKIIVCIKQVPYIDQLKFDPATMRVIRDGVESEINPFDKRAITKAIELRKQFGGEVSVVTMGPPQAKDALAEALAMGADRAVHLLGREFAGADTLATARALALACQKIGFDLVFCGKYSTDAETAQVPPMLAEMLDVPQVMGVTDLQVTQDGKTLTATRELDGGFEMLECVLPAVLSAAERLCKPIRCTPEDLESAKQKPIEVMTAADLGASVRTLGIAGSPTWVEKIYPIEPKRKRVIRNAGDNVDAVTQELVGDLLAEGLFGGWKDAAREVIKPRKSEFSVQNSVFTRSVQNSVWIVVELTEGKIRPVTFELLGRGIQLADKVGSEVAAVLIGHEVGAHAQTLAAYGADRIYVADDAALATYSTETYTPILASAIRARNPYAVLLPSTANGRDLAPRVAARLNIGLTGDCIGLEIDAQAQLVQLKPAFGGNIVAPILSKTRPAMATVRPGMLHSAEPDFARAARIEKLPTDHIASRTRVIRFEENAHAGIALDNAEIIVGVGMGVGGAENIATVRELAAALDAPIVGTRRVVDAGWLPRQVQVGLTGRSIAPRLYIALGISGKFNHVVGIQRSGIVVAINNNPNADIFKQADYGIVGDWAQIVPTLTRSLQSAHH